MSFKLINFGRASAESESTDCPNLLIKGYLDNNHYTEEAIMGNRFLFLGYKGSGKTALAEHLKLRAENASELFVRLFSLSDFPYKRFSDMINSSSELESRFPSAWSWLLLLIIIDSFSDDNGHSIEDQSRFLDVIDSYRQFGLLPAKTFKELILISSKKSIKAKLPLGIEVGIEKSDSNSDDIRFLNLVANLKKICSSFRSSSKHLLIIDGLDEILTGTKIQYNSISSLIIEAQKLNMFFKQNCSPAKVVILCRTDLFDKLPSPNKNKIRQDYAIEFNWFRDPKTPYSSELITLANLRSRIDFPNISNIFDCFFPPKIYDKNICAFLLQFTRHTPRDFLQLLIYLQNYYKKNRFTNAQIYSGVRDYSINYFFPEIKNELDGYMEPEMIEMIFRLITSSNKDRFYLNDIENERRNVVGADKVNLHEVFNILYDCGAIGNLIDRKFNVYFSFKYRNPHTIFSPKHQVVLHKGLLKSLNF